MDIEKEDELIDEKAKEYEEQTAYELAVKFYAGHWG